MHTSATHTFANWHNYFKGDESKLLFWMAAKAYNMVDYNDAFDEMENVNPDVVASFRGCNPKVFCRAFMKTD